MRGCWNVTQIFVEDINILRQPCERVKSYEDGKKIADELFSILKLSKDGIGLAANQVGINKKVCVVNVLTPTYFINPIIIESSGLIYFNEGCLSFPGQIVRTERYSEILVKADNFSSPKSFNFRESLLECVCVQHEIDHLSGTTMYDRQYKEK